MYIRLCYIIAEGWSIDRSTINASKCIKGSDELKKVIVTSAALVFTIASLGWAGIARSDSETASVSRPAAFQMQMLAEKNSGEKDAAEVKDMMKPSFHRKHGGPPQDIPDMAQYEGMTEEERSAAMKEDLKARLAEKVAEGIITQEQADQMLERFSGKPHMEFGLREEGQGALRFRDGDGEGLSFHFKLPDLLKYEGMTEEERAAAMKEDFAASLNEKVTEGAITREQADKMLENFHAFPGVPGKRGGFSMGTRRPSEREAEPGRFSPTTFSMEKVAAV